MQLRENHFKYKDKYQIITKGWKNTINTCIKKAVAAILMSEKIDFRTMNTAKDEEVYFIMIKESKYQEDIIILKVYLYPIMEL